MTNGEIGRGESEDGRGTSFFALSSLSYLNLRHDDFVSLSVSRSALSMDGKMAVPVE